MRMLKNRIADDSLWTLRYDSRRQRWSNLGCYCELGHTGFVQTTPGCCRC